jgi:hypothetical protein
MTNCSRRTRRSPNLPSRTRQGGTRQTALLRRPVRRRGRRGSRLLRANGPGVIGLLPTPGCRRKSTRYRSHSFQLPIHIVGFASGLKPILKEAAASLVFGGDGREPYHIGFKRWISTASLPSILSRGSFDGSVRQWGKPMVNDRVSVGK